ncbi:MAG TPA: V-type ATPase 116kDa subunit family protein [Nitrososphaerales archaeon]|nr:V-type ATPase 116kDa subunit family protein [Nitrososphaerales archaeon]
MAIAQLSRVTLLCPRADLGPFLSRLCDTGIFHPAERSGLVQDTQLVLLSSRAHAVYSDANLLLQARKSEAPPTVANFESTSMADLVERLAARTSRISDELRNPDVDPVAKAQLESELRSIRDAALTVFKDTSRIRVRPGPRRFLILEGFVPTSKLPLFKETMRPNFLSSEPIPRRQPGVPYVPSLVVNPRVVSLFEGITLSLGVPKYNEVDPTPVVAFVFPLFFGIMFSDVGRGLLLFVAGLGLRNNRRDDFRYLGRLLLVLGSASMIVGALRGLFFGVFLPYTPLLPSPSFLVQGPSIQTVTFWLEVGIAVGTIHLSAGYVLAIINRFLSKDYPEAFLSYLPTLVLYASAIPFVLALVGSGLSWEGVFTSTQPTPFFSTLLGVMVPVSSVAGFTFPILIASLVVLLLGRFVNSLYSTRSLRRSAPSLKDGVADSLVRPAEIFVHTISYIRLGILLVVESVFGELLAQLLALGLLGVVLAIPGNIAVVSIMAFIVYLQDLRLNVYEWFSKFYSGVGRPFAPLVSRGASFNLSWSFAAAP